MSIEIKNLIVRKPSSGSLDSNEILILNDLSIIFSLNKFHLIIGESGAGKTTLLNCFYSIEKFQSGSIKLNDDDIKKHLDEIKLLFQFNNDLLNPFRAVKSMLNDALRKSIYSKIDKENIILNYLNEFRLDEKVLSKKAFQLSGGEHQRVALIRLLLSNPKILLLDEPFSSQDFEANKIIAENLIKLRHEKEITIICVSHILENIIEQVDTITIMQKGQVIESNSKEFILRNSKSSLLEKFLLKN